jgi:hypothetical protein
VVGHGVDVENRTLDVEMPRLSLDPAYEHDFEPFQRRESRFSRIRDPVSGEKPSRRPARGEEIVNRLPVEAPKKRGPYKKKE